MPGWDRYPVRERFADYEVPIWVDNDVNIMALGELRAGIARGWDNVIFVKIGTGIGAGTIVKGKLHRGTKGCAGDIGHIQASEATRRWCAAAGTLVVSKPSPAGRRWGAMQRRLPAGDGAIFLQLCWKRRAH